MSSSIRKSLTSLTGRSTKQYQKYSDFEGIVPVDILKIPLNAISRTKLLNDDTEHKLNKFQLAAVERLITFKDVVKEQNITNMQTIKNMRIKMIERMIGIDPVSVEADNLVQQIKLESDLASIKRMRDESIARESLESLEKRLEKLKEPDTKGGRRNTKKTKMQTKKKTNKKKRRTCKK